MRVCYRLSVIDYELSLLFLAELQSFCLGLLLLINKNKKKNSNEKGVVLHPLLLSLLSALDLLTVNFGILIYRYRYLSFSFSLTCSLA